VTLPIDRQLSRFYATSVPYRDMLAGRDPAEFDRYVRLVRDAAPPGARMLEIGSGTGQAARALAAAGFEVTASDLSPLFLAEGRGLSRLAADVRALPFPNGAFDVVAGCEVLEHLPDVPRALAELVRVLAPAGLVVLRSPQLSSPIWPILDLPALARGEGRPPHYVTGRQAARFLVNNTVRSLRIELLGSNFARRRPDLSGAGGDADAVYWSSSREVSRCLEGLGCEVLAQVEMRPPPSRSWLVGRFLPALSPTIAVVARKLGAGDPPAPSGLPRRKDEHAQH